VDTWRPHFSPNDPSRTPIILSGLAIKKSIIDLISYLICRKNRQKNLRFWSLQMLLRTHSAAITGIPRRNAGNAVAEKEA
jgi:hypothetical protein